MSGAASLPGAELFFQIGLFFEQATCPGQLRCLGPNCFSKLLFSLNKPLVPGSFAAWGRTVFSKNDFFVEEATCPGQLRCLGQNFFPKIRLFCEQATCPGQLRCLGQNFFSVIPFFVNKHLSWAASLPGAELFLKKNTLFRRSHFVLLSHAGFVVPG